MRHARQVDKERRIGQDCLPVGLQYSPRRHWCSILKPVEKRGSKAAYSFVMTLAISDDLDWEFAFFRTLGIRPEYPGGFHGHEAQEKSSRPTYTAS